MTLTDDLTDKEAAALVDCLVDPEPNPKAIVTESKGPWVHRPDDIDADAWIRKWLT